MILPNMTTNYELRENTSGVFVIYSSTEKVVLDRLEGRQAVIASETIKLYEMIVETVDLAVKELTEEEQQFIKLRYYQNQSIIKICNQLGYSERHIHRIRYNVLNHFLISLANIKNLRI